MVSNSSATFANGTALTVTSWHARNLTTISWNHTAAHVLDKVVVYHDEAASVPWLRKWNAYILDPVGAVDFDDPASIGNWCQAALYAPDKWGAFHKASLYESAAPWSAAGVSTWFYTGTHSQNKSAALEAPTSATAQGTVNVVLADVGLFRVCVVPGGAPSGCVPTYCVSVEVYQPPEDYMEIEAGSIAEPTFTRFNSARRGATTLDWLWLATGLPDEETRQSLVSQQLSSAALRTLDHTCMRN